MTTREISAPPDAVSPTRGGWFSRVRGFALWVYKPSRSVLLPTLRRYVLMRPAVFEVWFRLRAWWFFGHARNQ